MKVFTRIFALFAVALMLAVLAGCAGTDTRSSTGEYLDDTAITARVKAAIFNHPDLRSSEINVETYRNVVQLSGFVSSQAEIDAAVDLTRTIAGVQSVKNDMRLR
ncbi:BON domain-containing protein [Wenzhouxiangella sp. AB-CW3]|jgi:osmotically-inducible protein OsmY|uniref:BON domain-containing protein n=1 Tax=Wenzhouxiangella sp. AB-CW3 TaxID=2771012 RepID=UPI00168A88AC|nr:BON domain-containing protein [Wenzhouxiangella sp. AB-CW3]QOC21990.1 BON domain-containing protein [Wenzhouxiangella sp. AB-CW3]